MLLTLQAAYEQMKKETDDLDTKAKEEYCPDLSDDH